MKFFYLSLCLVFLSLGVHSQNIKVLNSQTKEPVFGVAIYNVDKTKSVITNFNGEADLGEFNDTETIYFKHLSHTLKTINKKQIGKLNKVFLVSNTQGLQEIVISASKFKQNKRDIPQKILSANAKSIQFNNPQTSADLLENTGQVYIQKSQLGGGSPMIRGFSTNRLLITVDGVRMNNAIFRGGNLQNVIAIDPFAIQNTEVTLGAGSVTYGSDAIGGVMSFYTLKPKLSYTDSLMFKANAVVRYASASNERTGHFDFNLGYKKWAFITSASYTDFDDLRMGSHGPEDYLRPEFAVATSSGDVIIENDNPLVQKYSGYSQFNVMQKAHYEPYEDLSFDLGLYYSTTSNIPRYDRLIRYRSGVLRSTEWNYGPQNWFMSNLEVTKLSSRSNLYDKIKATVAYQNFQESRMDRDFQSTTRSVSEEAVNAYSFNIDLEKKLSPKTEFFYGGEYIYNKVKSVGYNQDTANNTEVDAVTRYPNGSSWQSAAVYSSIKYKPNPKFVFQSGLRFNYVVSEANFTENNVFLNLPFDYAKNESEALTGTAGISWTPSPKIQWKLNASSAFRAPNIDDIGKVFDSEPGSVVVPNNNLKSEYAYGSELGLKLNFNNKLVLDMSTYYTYLDNALVRRDYSLNGETEILYNGELSNVQAIQNASKAWIYGFEVGLKMPITNQLDLTSQYSVIGGTEEEESIEVPIRHVAPNFGNTHLTWTSNAIKLDFFANYNGDLSYYELAPSEIEKDYIYALDANGNPYSPSWYTVNFRAQYQVNNAITLTTSLENITDQRYKTYSSGIAAAGRNLIVALKYSL
ncbi:outer membrane beta-barrel protein [Algibacter amylolyticus]|uniref:Outer membrane beta-barrel protein n=1 Tax=Algibacter amylolyticus TaxID=1608400 RepID=A0A5M7BC34_9FLAO|nr:TonB-dependent receptor [Algibacter amylolyticus]KAA5827286.1 outer membrane beta-barrel protein [Algibacter amylolyticus]MBB5266467.1 hemoglobin/transferrin/lactoferrin receptor protein [Algibacter amylolyticus]TSJ81531.1 outer membrane beta-barrel protein [Algibacter amylolyticus]